MILNPGEDTTFEEDLAQDVIEIITVFSARLYGSLSPKNQKLLDGVKTAMAESQSMLIAHKIALDLNNVQATYMARAAGTARFAYNWALAEWQRQYAAHRADPSLPRPSQAALRRQLNAIKAEQFPWMLEVTKNAPKWRLCIWEKHSGTSLSAAPATRGSARKGCATASPSPTTNSVWTAPAYAFPSWVGCACASRCASREKSCRRRFPAWPTAGLSVSPWIRPIPRIYPKPRTKAR